MPPDPNMSVVCITIEMLGNVGYRTEGANDGYDAVAKAAAERFDLILMDISMPGMDGIQATREIRAGDGRSRDATIYALTAHAMEEERQQLAESGMEHFLNKPLRMNALLDALALFRLGEDLKTSHGNHHEDALKTAPIIDFRSGLPTRSSISSRLPWITASRLLKSWATPPVRRPMDCIFCACSNLISLACKFSSARFFSVISLAMPR